MQPILTKQQNYRLWQSGAFGNKLRAWRTVEEWRASGFAGLVALRTLLPAGGGPCAYNLTRDRAIRLVNEWDVSGIVPYQSIMVNEAAPDEAVLLQGEYLNDAIALGYFLHSRVTKHMREALGLRSETTYGLHSDFILREAMTPSSYDDWQILIERYPGHVFEVSIYDRCLGDIPNRNALVWEIRRY
jgi:hypothetical protein